MADEQIIEAQAVEAPVIRLAVISANVVVNTILAPEGYELEGYELVASDTAEIGQLYADGEFIDPPPAPVTTDQVNAERERRILKGETFDGVYVTGDDTNRSNLSGLAFGASLRISQGDTTTITVFRDGNNVDHELTPPALLSVWSQAANHVSMLYEKSWALKAMEPIPADYQSDAYWSAE